MNDHTQFEQVDETCEFGGAVLYSESLGITAFFENAVPSKYETQKLKLNDPTQFEQVDET